MQQASFPPKADTLLLDTYLTNEEAASARIFRVYRPTPHYHATCDEYLYVLSGRGTFWLENPKNNGIFGPGQIALLQEGRRSRVARNVRRTDRFPLRRHTMTRPRDVIFLSPNDGTPESLIKGLTLKNNS